MASERHIHGWRVRRDSSGGLWFDKDLWTWQIPARCSSQRWGGMWGGRFLPFEWTAMLYKPKGDRNELGQ